MFKILVAEDDADLRRLFCQVLRRSGFLPVPAAAGAEALELLESEFVDLIVSDIMMPRVDGYELVQTLRESGSQIPVLMITAKDRFQDMQLGFLSGTDDFMVKPVNVNEMILRIRALLRRAKLISDRRLTVGGTTLEFDVFTVHWGSRSQVLPQKEFQLLYKLASSMGQIFTRQQLMDDIWGVESETDTHTVDVHIGRLRDRLRDNPDLEIVTVRGLGYKVVRKHG